MAPPLAPAMAPVVPAAVPVPVAVAALGADSPSPTATDVDPVASVPETVVPQPAASTARTESVAARARRGRRGAIGVDSSGCGAVLPRATGRMRGPTLVGADIPAAVGRNLSLRLDDAEVPVGGIRGTRGGLVAASAVVALAAAGCGGS